MRFPADVRVTSNRASDLDDRLQLTGCASLPSLTLLNSRSRNPPSGILPVFSCKKATSRRLAMPFEDAMIDRRRCQVCPLKSASRPQLPPQLLSCVGGVLMLACVCVCMRLL